jgi:hypothetical protein
VPVCLDFELDLVLLHTVSDMVINLHVIDLALVLCSSYLKLIVKQLELLLEARVPKLDALSLLVH